MSSPGQKPSPGAPKGWSGSQGTRLFSTASLRQYASEADIASDGPASAKQPTLEGVSAGIEHLRFSLRAGRQTIGRGADNDIIIDDPSVSASHGWIIIQSGRYAIMNTLSTNGTYVNDKRIHDSSLKHGDHIRLGQAELLFLTRKSKPYLTRPRWLALGLIATLLVAVVGVLAWRLF